ncbi:hypothetical protein [Hymenobacter mellowenesis]|nr:hypothetical protein [Hymenobacter sp. M29]
MDTKSEKGLLSKAAESALLGLVNGIFKAAGTALGAYLLALLVNFLLK